jgi:hypothetical protein
MSSPITRKLTAYLIIGSDACLEFPVTAGYDMHDPYAVRLDFPAARRPDTDADIDADIDASDLPGADAAADPSDAEAPEVDVPSWMFGRELLADGLREPAGEGDVHVWPCGSDVVMVELRSDRGSALLAVPARELRTFLFLSYAEVPPGYEGRYLELDRLLHDLMGRA